MFPSVFDDTNEINNEISNKDEIITTSTELKKTPIFDFENKKMIMNNGEPLFKDDIEAVRQWIVLFLKTPKDVYKIYGGTSFGTSLYKLFGNKILNNGYEESEIERELREGLTLCPAIYRLTNFNLEQKGKILNVYIQVELYDGTLVDSNFEVKYVLK